MEKQKLIGYCFALLAKALENYSKYNLQELGVRESS
jgi:hypothetical protein